MRNKKLAVVVVLGIILIWGYFHFKNKAEIKEKNIKERIELQEFLKEYNSTLEEKRELVKKMKNGEVEMKYKTTTFPSVVEKLPIIPYTKDLPPVPNEEENNSTIFGVDVNKNGVRDDLEILTVKLFGDDRDIVEAEFAAIRADGRADVIANKAIKNDIGISYKDIESIQDDIDIYISCIGHYGRYVDALRVDDKIYKKQFNTLERKKTEGKIIDNMRGGGGSSFKATDKGCKEWFEETRHYEYFNKN